MLIDDNYQINYFIFIKQKNRRAGELLFTNQDDDGRTDETKPNQKREGENEKERDGKARPVKNAKMKMTK